MVCGYSLLKEQEIGGDMPAGGWIVTCWLAS